MCGKHLCLGSSIKIQKKTQGRLFRVNLELSYKKGNMFKTINKYKIKKKKLEKVKTKKKIIVRKCHLLFQ